MSNDREDKARQDFDVVKEYDILFLGDQRGDHKLAHEDALRFLEKMIREDAARSSCAATVPGLRLAVEIAERYLPTDDAVRYLRNDLKDALLKASAVPEYEASKSVDEAFYKLTVQQRDAAWREVEALKRELAEAYAEMRKQWVAVTAVFDRDVWKRAREAK